MNYLLIPGIKSNSIIDVVCRKYAITKEDLYNKKRADKVPEARQIIMWYEMEYLHKTPREAAARFNKDRTTGNSTRKRINGLIEVDKYFKAWCDDIVAELK